MSLSTLTVSVCLTMALLCGLMALQFMLRSRIFLPKYTKMPTVCDLLDYATLASDDVIVLKSGCLMSMMELFIPDMSAYSESKLESCYELCQKALLKLEGNYAIQIDAIRAEANDYAPSLSNKNLVLCDLEERREAKFKAEGSFDTRIYLTITYVGDSKQTRLLSGLISKSFNNKNCEADTLNLIKDFRQRVKIVADSLRLCFPVQLLGTEEIRLNERLKPLCAQHAADAVATSTAVTTAAADPIARAVAAELGATATTAAAPTAARASTASEANADADCGATNDAATDAKTAIAKDLHSAQAHNAATVKAAACDACVAIGAKEVKSSEGKDKLGAEKDDAEVVATVAETVATVAEAEATAADGMAQASAAKAGAKGTVEAKGAAAGAAEASAAAVAVAAGDELKPALKARKANGAENSGSVGYEELFDRSVADGKFVAARRGKRRVSRLLSVIHECITGKPHLISTPGSRGYLDSLLATEDYISGYTPKMGSKFVCMLSIEGLPSATHEALLNTLATLPFAYRFNTRFVIFDHGKSKVFLMRYRARWSQSQKGILSQIFNMESTKVNQNAVDQVKDIDSAQRALDNNEVMFGSYTANVIIYDERIGKLKEKAAAAIAAIEKTGLAVRVETVNSDDAFFGSLPGHITENLRRPLISQDVLLDLIPLSLPPRGERYSPNPLYGHNSSPLMQVRTVGGSKYLLNLHEKDVGNTLVIGPTGAGKSMLLSELIVNLLRYKGMRVFAFDKGCSFHALTKALGGKYIVLNNSERMLSPLYHLETEEDKDYAQSFIELLLRETNVECTPEFRYEIKQSLCSLASLPHQLHRLSNLHGLICNQTLKQALAAYTAEQSDNCILDGNEDTAVSNNITTFECAEVFSRPESFSVPVLKHVFRLIERQLTGAPVAIVVDEAWLMLRDSHFADELLNWFKTLRKYNAFVILATQSLTDLQASEHFENILECAKTRIFLPNCDAVSEALKDAYTMMGLSDQEIDLVASAVPKRDYYFVKGEQRVLFNLMLSAEEKALLSIAGEHCVPSTNAMFNTFGPLFYTQLVDNEEDIPSAASTFSVAPSAATATATATAAPAQRQAEELQGQGTALAATSPAALQGGDNLDAVAAGTASTAVGTAIGAGASTAAAGVRAASGINALGGISAGADARPSHGQGPASAREALAIKAAATILKDAAKASNTEVISPGLLGPLKKTEFSDDSIAKSMSNTASESGRDTYRYGQSDKRSYSKGWSSKGQTPRGEYTKWQYPKGQTPKGEYTKGQYQRGEYAKGAYPQSYSSKEEYSRGQSLRGDYGTGQYARQSQQLKSSSSQAAVNDVSPSDEQAKTELVKGNFSHNANSILPKTNAVTSVGSTVATASSATPDSITLAAADSNNTDMRSFWVSSSSDSVVISKPPKTFSSALMAGAKWLFGSEDNAKPGP